MRGFSLKVTKMRPRKTFNLQPSTLNFFGFTLLEMLVVLAIMSLLTAMSAPAISGYLKGARLKGAARQVASALRQARTLAITKRARRAVLLYFQDTGATTFYNAVSVYENDTLSYKYLPDTISLRNSSGGVGTNGNGEDARVTFNPNGTTDNDTFRVRDTVGNYREIVVNTAGRVKVGDVK